MRAVELQLYAYLWRDLPGGKAMARTISKVLSGRQTCRARGLKVCVPGCRMSGEMCTSLGNGFTNLVLMAFVCAERGYVWDGVVEGDDGLFVVGGDLDARDFERLGFRIKLVRHDRVSTAGFCKFVYDEESLENVADPAELLAKFGWTHSQLKDGGVETMRALLRGKVYSLKSELGGAPIVGSLVRWVDRTVGCGKILHNTRDGRLDYWMMQKQSCRRSLRPVTQGSRLVVEKVYGVSVATQLAIESYIDSLKTLCPLDGPVSALMKPAWRAYWQGFVVHSPAGTDCVW